MVVLGHTLDDAPVPVLAASGAKVYAVYYARDRADGGTQRSIVVGEFRTASPPQWTPLRTLSEQPDESLSVDLAADEEGVVAVWDEDHGAPPRGRIVGARVSASGDRGPYVVLSPPDHDCESPTAVAHGGQLVTAWLVREADEDPKVRDTAPEGPAEGKDRRWVEARTTNARELAMGLPGGAAPRAVTSQGGHVTSIAFAPVDGDEEGAALFVVDEATRRGAVGGRLYKASNELSFGDGPVAPRAVDGSAGDARTGDGRGRTWRVGEWVVGGQGAVSVVVLGHGGSHWVAWEDGAGRTSVARAGTKASLDGGVAAPEPRWTLPDGLRPIGVLPRAQEPPSVVAVRGDAPTATWVVWSLQP
jgi:hypothetical protein